MYRSDIDGPRGSSMSVGRGLLAVVCAFLVALSVQHAFGEPGKKPKTNTDRPKEYPDPATGMEFVFVKGGCYPMGDTFGDGDSDEQPVHEVCVSDLYMGKYVVTQEQWEKVMGGNPSSFKKGGRYPVENVSWLDVKGFITRLNGKKGRTYRLPTEAEWEYAARSGGKKEKWAGTSSEWELEEYAWFFDHSGRSTHLAGEKRPNGLGLYDMTGNVWEWCGDWYERNYYSFSPRNDPQGPSRGTFRVLRGGSWSTDARYVRASTRHWSAPELRNNKRGFRLVRPARD
jgi:formylglycine-generating enzyme required for sulfatase activity